MDIIPTNLTSFEKIVNNLIKEIKITGLDDSGILTLTKKGKITFTSLGNIL